MADFGFKPSAPETPDVGFAGEGQLKPEGFYERNIPRPIKDAIGGIESAGRMVWNVPVGTAAKGLGTLGGLVAGQGLDKSLQTGDKVQSAVSIPALTKSGELADEALGHGYEYVKRDVVAEAMLALDRHEWNTLKIPKDQQMQLEASRRSLYEGGFDATMFAGMIKSGLSIPKAIKAQKDQIQADAARKEQAKTQFDDGSSTTPKTNTTKYNPQDLELGFKASGDLELPPDSSVALPRQGQFMGTAQGGGLLDPRRKAELEAELNPPVEQRIQGQGELFTGERAYPEAMAGETRVSPPEASGRDRNAAAREDVLDIPDRTNQRVRPADELAYRPEEGMVRQDVFDPLLEDPSQVRPRQERAAEESMSQRVEFQQEPFKEKLGESDLVARAERGEVPPAEFAGRSTSDFVRQQRLDYARQFAESELKKQTEEGSLPWNGPGSRQRGSIGEPPKPKPKNVEEYHKDFRGRVADRASEMIEKVDAWKKEGKYQFNEGDIVQSKNTGKTYEISPFIASGRNVRGVKEADSPNYHLKSLDGSEHFNTTGVDIAHKNFTKLSGPLPKGPGNRQRGAVNLFGKTTEKKGVIEAIKNFKHFWTEDTRPIKEVMDEKHPNLKPEDVKDLDPKHAMREKAAGNFLIDKQMSILAQGKGPMATVIKWVVDNQNHINRQLKMRIEESTKVALDPWRNLKKTSHKQLESMLETVQKNNKERKVTSEQDFTSPKQWEAYKAVHKVLTDVIERGNAVRRKADPSGKVLRPIKLAESYLPSVREGDFWIYIHDKSGNLKHAEAFQTKFAANAAYAKLKKDMGGEYDVKEPITKRISEHDLSSLDAYEETLQALHKGDPVAKAIRDRLNFLLGRRGFGRHGLQKKGIGGALGWEGGKLGVKNMERVLESYITRGETHIANLERSLLERQISELSDHKFTKDSEGRVTNRATLFETAPIAKQWVDEYLARSKGKSLDLIHGVRLITDTLSNAAGFSKGAVPRFIQNLSSVASLFYLATVRNAMVQLTQPMNAMAKFVEIQQMKGDNPALAVIKAPFVLFDGYVEAFKDSGVGKKVGLKGGDLSAEAKQWAIKNGLLESAIVGLIEGKLSNFKGEGSKVVGELARWSLGKIEQHAVRTPVLLGFEKQLREAIPNKLERFEVAAQLTDNYMVHYDRESSPLMYDKAGTVIGESARGLKTYGHNSWGQFFEYMQTARDKKQLTPLATFLGTQAAVGGLRGIFLVAEATAAITVINTLFGLDIPTPEQLMLQQGLSDRLIFGGASTLIGRDVSASVAAPSMPQLMNFVPIEFGWKIASEVFPFLVKAAKGLDTDEDAMKAMLALAPAQARGWVEYLFAKEGGNIPNPYDNMKGNFPVPDDSLEKFERFGLNFKTLDEAKINMIVRNAKQISAARAERKLDVIDAIVDRIENGGDIPPYLLEKFVKEGGNMNTLPKMIQSRIQDKQLDYEQRTAKGKTVTPDKMKKLEELREMMDEDLRKNIDEKKQGGFKKSGFSEDFADLEKRSIQQEGGFGPAPDRKDRRDRVVPRLPDGRAPMGEEGIPAPPMKLRPKQLQV